MATPRTATPFWPRLPMLCRGLKLLPRPKTLNLRHRTLSYEPRRSLASTCSVGPTDSRHPSHAPLAYDGNLLCNDIKGLGGVQMAAQGTNGPLGSRQRTGGPLMGNAGAV